MVGSIYIYISVHLEERYIIERLVQELFDYDICCRISGSFPADTTRTFHFFRKATLCIAINISPNLDCLLQTTGQPNNSVTLFYYNVCPTTAYYILTNILIFGEMCGLLTYISEAVYRFCALSYLIFISSVCYFQLFDLCFYYSPYICFFLFFVFYFMYLCFLLFCVLLLILCCLLFLHMFTDHCHLGWKPNRSK